METIKNDLYNVNGTHYQGELRKTYSELEHAYGKPNGESDGYKTDVEWEISTPYGIATIYNWKNGRNYNGEDGCEVEDIMDWNVGGHNEETYKWIEADIQKHEDNAELPRKLCPIGHIMASIDGIDPCDIPF